MLAINELHWQKLPLKAKHFLRCDILDFLNKFKHIDTLNLIIFGKNNTIYVSLVNVTMRLNLIGKLNVLYLKAKKIQLN